MRSVGGGGAYSFVACLSHLIIGPASLSRVKRGRTEETGRGQGDYALHNSQHVSKSITRRYFSTTCFPFTAGRSRALCGCCRSWRVATPFPVGVVVLKMKTNLPEIAFLGRSNVGKSSMLNTLFGESVAKVSKTPGRTRQINIFKVTMHLCSLPFGWVASSAFFC